MTTRAELRARLTGKAAPAPDPDDAKARAVATRIASHLERLPGLAIEERPGEWRVTDAATGAVRLASDGRTPLVFRSAEGAEYCLARLVEAEGDTPAPPTVAPRELAVEVQRLEGLLNAPEVRDFVKGVALEAAHQRQRWGAPHDEGKAPADWFWLVGYLAGKALHAHVAGNAEKALHHTVSTAAALCNWHAAILGKTDMRPGIATPAGEGEAAQ